MAASRSFLRLLARGCLAAMILLAAFPPVQSGVPAQAEAAPFGGLWLTMIKSNASYTQKESLAIDPNGGQHAVFNPLTLFNGRAYPVLYAYCARYCSNPAFWSYVPLGAAGSGSLGPPAIALTPQGQPRVVWFGPGSAIGWAAYYFAECDADCTLPASWKIGKIWEIREPCCGTDLETETRYLAIDPSGAAHIVYASYPSQPDPPHDGILYASCAGSCTLPESWTSVKIAANPLDRADLKIDSAGRPRLVYMGIRNYLIYMECDANCGSAENWRSANLTSLLNFGEEHPIYSLALTRAGNPRLALSNGFLYYARCDTGCTTLANWSVASQAVANSGLRKEVDLALDSQDRPYIAYPGPTYSACTAGCNTGTPAWSTQVVDTGDLDPIPSPGGTCSESHWYPGYDPSLALDANDQPRFVYGVQNTTLCIDYSNPKLPYSFILPLATGVRYATSDTSLPVLDHHVYIVSVKK